MWSLINDTPYAVERCFARDRTGAEFWAVAVKGTFRVCPGGATELEEEQQPVCLAPKFLGEPGRSSLFCEPDLQPFKPSTDVLLHGHAHAPGGTPVSCLDVHMQVGEISKTIRVFGDRYWEGRTAPRLSEPEPFVKMPLRYERAFGGGSEAWDPRNPIGTGAPNLEHPQHLIRSWEDRPAPAGFGPLCRDWSPRRELAGTYDEKWQQERLPLPPEDFDERFYLCAPPDQQVPDFLRGGEPVVLRNLSPQGELRFHLPRVWLTFSTRLGGQRLEHRSRLHTVLLEPDFPRVTLVWVTSLPCHQREQELEETRVGEKSFLAAAAGED